MGIGLKCLVRVQSVRLYHKTATKNNSLKCKLLIVGGGTGGCSIAWRMAKKLPDNNIIVLEPSPVHYYQPLFTLVAAGIKTFPETCKLTQHVLPRKVAWLRDQALHLDPCNREVFTKCGNRVQYEYMVVALGLVNDYDLIPGLHRGLISEDPVTTIYSPQFCVKAAQQIAKFKGGHAVFTYPRRGGKCSGAAQKIMYLAEHSWRKRKIPYNITYVTGSENIFGVPKYANALSTIAANRNIAVDTEVELVEICKQQAKFIYRDEKPFSLPFNFIHVAPPMSPPACLAECGPLVTPEGYLHVDQYTLQHQAYPNVYGIGDCLCTPNSKTAAAISEQSVVVAQNLWCTMKGERPTAQYSGYGACPMLTSHSTGILAEFVYGKKVRETFPFDQSKERRLFYHLNTKILPSLYWNKLIKGKWSGPARLRKLFNPFRK